MQPFVPGYRLLQEIHRSNRTLVFRAVRESDGRPVVIKTLHQDYPDGESLARLRREHDQLLALRGDGVVQVVALVPWKNNLALVMEDHGAQALSAQLGAGAMPLSEFFRVASATVRVLGELHGRAIHRDLRPCHLLWHAERDAVTLVDFSSAEAIAPGRQTLEAPRAVVGSLPYVSPEQTGRLNRGVDFRTDYYSLGVTFYRLLTGQLPFTANDPLEWVHCHITRLPRALELLNPSVPAMLGRVVLKLLAKNPDDRYQSAQGLLHDLQACERQWRETGAITPFALGTQDVSGQFQVPDRLYGRAHEVEVLEAAYDRAAAARPAFVAVAGPAGIGKSALVHEACRAMVAKGARFAEGKCDQFRRQGAYAAIAQALGALVRQLLAEPEERLATWRQRLLDRLGPNGRLAVDLVPELAGIIGQPPPVPATHPTEEQNRFHATIQSLVAAFARPEHPLVLFLDDLQWSDGATLTLVRGLLEPRDGHAILIIGAYRDDEAPDGHPLREALAELARADRMASVKLEALDEATLNALVADTFHTAPEQTLGLAATLHAKSAGNPFFAGELLRSLHQDGLFTFDHAGGRWHWDLDAIRRAQLSDDIVGFVVSRIQRLAAETQRLLRLAACIGDTFELALLAKLGDRPPAEATAALLPAIGAGLIAPVDAGAMLGLDGQATDAAFQFLHDRVRQAAYALNPDGEREATHMRIGRLLLEATPEAERELRASAIAQQLNAGRACLTSPAEREELAWLNLSAARKAKESAAYRLAYQFAEVAHELLPDSPWRSHPDLAAATLKLHASCAYLSGELAVAQASYDALLAHLTAPLDRAEVHAMRAAQYTFGSRMDAAIDEGILALALLGIKLSPQPGMAAVGQELLTAKLTLGLRKAEDLEHAPLLEDRTIRLAMKILEGFLVPAYLSGRDTLFASAVLKQAILSMRHGTCDESISAYSGFAVLLAGLGDLKGAYAFGQLALRLSEKLNVQESRSRILVLYALFSHSWSRPWNALDGWFKASVEAGLQSGDFLFLAYAAGYIHLWDPTADLKSAVDEGRKHLALIKQTTYQNALDAAYWHHQLRLNLRGETDGPLSLGDATFDEAEGVARMQRNAYVSGLGIYHLCKLQAACFQEAWELAWEHVVKGEGHIAKALAGSPYVVEFAVYGFMAAAQRTALPGAEGRQAWKRLKKFHGQMRRWARHCPENFRAHLVLMDAELARLTGRASEAERGYEAAVTAARASGFVRYEAQANEAAARYYRSVGLDRVAQSYLREARAGYLRWGAVAKVRALDLALPDAPRHGGDRGPVDVERLHTIDLRQVPHLVEAGMLDLSTVWKATQAISGEANFERLLKQLVAIVKENAGAQRCVLLLQEGDDAPRYLVQAESSEAGQVTLFSATPYEEHAGLPVSLVRYVIRSQTSVVLNEPATQGDYVLDPYLQAVAPRSVLAMPIVNQGQPLGVLYLENRLLADAFTPERLAVLQIVAGQAAVSLQNVRQAERAAYLEAERRMKDTYARMLEVRVEERTAELMQAYQQLMELDRLKTNFLNAVSHELRTPLTSIVGFGEFLKDELGGPLSPLQQEFVLHIRKGAKHLQGLVDDLLDFAQLEAGTFRLDPQWGYLGESVSQAFESLRPQAKEKSITLECQLPETDVEGTFDPVRVEQVVINLVGNAIKFTPAGGRVTLRMVVEEGWARLSVTDTGIGIPAELHDRLFQKFYQVDPSSTRKAGGTGLGLAISKGLAEAMGGTVGVESTPGAGSTFWFTFPLHGTPPDATAINPGMARPAQAEG